MSKEADAVKHTTRSFPAAKRQLSWYMQTSRWLQCRPSFHLNSRFVRQGGEDGRVADGGERAAESQEHAERRRGAHPAALGFCVAIGGPTRRLPRSSGRAAGAKARVEALGLRLFEGPRGLRPPKPRVSCARTRLQSLAGALDPRRSLTHAAVLLGGREAAVASALAHVGSDLPGSRTGISEKYTFFLL